MSSHVCCQTCWPLLTQTLELFQVFCDANTTDKSIITWISALNSNTLIPACFTPPALERGAGETASRAGAHVHHEVKGAESRNSCLVPPLPSCTAWPRARSLQPPSATPGWASTPRDSTPAGTQGPRGHVLVPQVGWEETRKEGKTPELGTV